jgi:hypothetical protein
MTETPIIVPSFSGARAARDYAQRAALAHQGTIRRLLGEGLRRHQDLADALNRLDGPSPTGRPWDARMVGRTLQRLGIKRDALEQADAEAMREQVEGLWEQFIRTPPQIAIALTRQSVPCPGGGRWTAARVGTVLRRLAGDWMTESNGRLRRGDSVPMELPTVEEVVALVEAADVPPAIEVEEPQAATPRRRAIRV